VALAEQTAGTAPERLELVVKIVLRAWRDDPDLVRLLVREVTRNPHIQDELDEIGRRSRRSSGSWPAGRPRGRSGPRSTPG
jgi:hypothetical protein